MTPACPPRRGTQAGARVAGSKPEDATSIQPYVRTYVRACVRACSKGIWASAQRAGWGSGRNCIRVGELLFFCFFLIPPPNRLKCSQLIAICHGTFLLGPQLSKENARCPATVCPSHHYCAARRRAALLRCESRVDPYLAWEPPRLPSRGCAALAPSAAARVPAPRLACRLSALCACEVCCAGGCVCRWAAAVGRTAPTATRTAAAAAMTRRRRLPRRPCKRASRCSPPNSASRGRRERSESRARAR